MMINDAPIKRIKNILVKFCPKFLDLYASIHFMSSVQTLRPFGLNVLCSHCLTLITSLFYYFYFLSTFTYFGVLLFNVENPYSVFQGFSKAKSANGGSILSSSQFLILPQLPQKIKLTSKVVKVDSKIIILLSKIHETHCTLQDLHTLLQTH